MIEPFLGWRWRNQPHVAPVLDALSPQQLERLRQEPHQVIHLALPTSGQALQAYWEAFQRECVLQREPLPTLYAYSQTFYRYGEGTAYHRVGVVGVLSTPEVLLPHEETLSERVEGIVQAFQALPLQTTPVHVLAEGRWAEIQSLLQAYLSCPLFSVGGSDGVMHRWSPIHHYQHQQQIREALRGGRWLIADGHHRRQAAQQAGLRKLLVYLTPAHDPSLWIVPAHRFFRGSLEEAELDRYFSLVPSAARVPLWREVEGLRYAIGVVKPGGKAFTARLRPAFWPQLADRPLVAWLHTWVLEGRAGEVIFSREPAPLVEAAERGEGWAFILPSLPLEYVWQAALRHVPLPPKATYFFPKVLSGVCFYYEGDTGFGFTSA